MKDNLLLEYSRQFAKEAESLCKRLSDRRETINSVSQLRRSSSSIFANISEAQYPQSLADMLSKLRIALKECNETESWLDMLHDSDYINNEDFRKIRNSCGRIKRILIASCKTINNKLAK